MERVMDEDEAGYHTHHIMSRPILDFSDFKAAIMKAPVWLVFLEFCLVSASCCFLFAVFYYFNGEECFILSREFSFEQMVYLSIHTFTTVGYAGLRFQMP